MQKKGSVKKKVQEVRTEEGKYCVKCSKLKKRTDFYSTNAMFSSLDGKMNVCKSCILSMIDENDLNTVKSILRQIDKPFIPLVWESSKNSERSTFPTYMRQINSLNQYKTMTWADGLLEIGNTEEDSLYETKSTESIDKKIVKEKTEDKFVNPLDKFVLTPELQLKWGTEFTKEDIYQMETLWLEMLDGYIVETPAERDYLKKCCMTSVLADKAYKRGAMDEGNKLIKTYNDLMKDAVYAPSKRNSSDRTGGVNSFSELFEAIEKEGFIPVWPNVNNDAIDETITHLKRWTRELVLGEQNLATLIEVQLKKMNIESESTGLDQYREEDDNNEENEI